MYTPLYCFLLSSTIALVASAEDCQGGSACDADRSWTAAMEGEDEGLGLLQLRGYAGRNCPMPDIKNFQAIGKGCGTEPAPGQDDPCLAGNRRYNALKDAWLQCGQNPDCGGVMQASDGAFYLRRATDPDVNGDGSKLYKYDCKPVLEEGLTEEDPILVHDPDEEEKEALKLVEVQEVPKCPLPDLTKFTKSAKGCPNSGHADNGCLNNNQPYGHLERAWEECEKNEFCEVVMAYTDGNFYLRRAADPDIKDEGAKLYAYPCKQERMKKDIIERKAREQAEKLIKDVDHREADKLKVAISDMKMRMHFEEHELKKIRDEHEREAADEEQLAEKHLGELKRDYDEAMKVDEQKKKELAKVKADLQAATKAASKDQKKLEDSVKRVSKVDAYKVQFQEEVQKLATATKMLKAASAVKSDADNALAKAKNDAAKVKFTQGQKVEEAEHEAGAEANVVKALQAKEKQQEEELVEAQSKLAKAKKVLEEQQATLKRIADQAAWAKAHP